MVFLLGSLASFNRGFITFFSYFSFLNCGLAVFMFHRFLHGRGFFAMYVVFDSDSFCYGCRSSGFVVNCVDGSDVICFGYYKGISMGESDGSFMINTDVNRVKWSPPARVNTKVEA